MPNTTKVSSLPALGICGFSGSGKTTLIERLIPVLVAQGLKIALIKHDVHGLQVDREGKDSDRLFKAGADVYLNGPDQLFSRHHGADNDGLVPRIRRLSREYDLILVEGHKGSPINKVWLLADGEAQPPPGHTGIISVLPWDADRFNLLLAQLADWLPQQWQIPPVYGLVIPGSGDHEVKNTASLEKACERVIVSGNSPTGGLPPVPDADGTLAAVIAAMRWAPTVSWLVTVGASKVSRDALNRLLDSRAPGVWGSIYQQPNNTFTAHFDYRAIGWLERLAIGGDISPQKLLSHPKFIELEMAASRSMDSVDK
jgi:molybdopterin-guanine dinucleotide biosynthesis protein MobB